MVVEDGNHLVTNHLDNHYFFSSDCVVTVVSAGGWSFLLAMLQLGVPIVHCLPVTEEAKRELRLLRENLPEPTQALPCEEIPRDCLVLGFFFDTEPYEWLLGALGNAPRAPEILVAMSPISSGFDEGRLPGYNLKTRKIKHRSLGGLTTATMRGYWFYQSKKTVPPPSLRHFPKRPLDRFLEPSSQLKRWYSLEQAHRRGLRVWRPTLEGATPLPYQRSLFPELVEAPSVYFGGKLICRPFSAKEKMQILDLRADFENLLPQMWKWDGGCSPPLRLIVDACLSVAEWVDEYRRDVTQQSFETAPTDWGRVRPPWLHTPGTEIPGTTLQRRSFFRWVWDPLDSANVTVARKADDAGVDEALWSVGGDDARKARDSLRTFFRRLQRRKTTKEVLSWLASQAESGEQDRFNREGIRECLTRLQNASWWEWSHGSRLHFWRWPGAWQREARDGAKAYHLSKPPPKTRFNNVPIKDEWVIKKDEEKMLKLLKRGYLEEGPYQCVIPRFPIPKVYGPEIPQEEWDIRVVWDLSKNGVNGTLYTPRFFLPTPGTYLRRLEAGMFAGDFDVGEQFHNYPLHPSERIYAGALISESLRKEAAAQGIPCPQLARFARLPFGWQSSPYLALRMHARILELSTRVDDPASAYYVSTVELNLPGMKTYDPSKPRVRLLDSTGGPTAQLVSFFDDGRPFARDESLARQALRQVTSWMQWFGTQDAARKRRPLSQRPGAWAGCVAYTDQGLVRKFIPQKKWDRLLKDLSWLRSFMGDLGADSSLEEVDKADVLLGEPVIPRRRFKSFVGFLIHVAGVYDDIQPYLHGFFLAENQHLQDRDQEGYKIPSQAEPESKGEYEDLNLYEQIEDGAIVPEEVGEFRDDTVVEPGEGTFGKSNLIDELPKVPVTRRLVRDVMALSRIFRGDTPFQVIERPVAGVHCVFYGGGDASGEGFGAKLSQASNLVGSARTVQGFWCSEVSEQSSNYRELRNAFDSISREAVSGRIVGGEVWFATDNSTTELAFAKGRSSSRLLDELVLRFRELAIRYNFQLRIVHIAGTRMIALGIDGLSRGEQEVGALVRGDWLPLHLNASARCSSFSASFANIFGEGANAPNFSASRGAKLPPANDLCPGNPDRDYSPTQASHDCRDLGEPSSKAPRREVLFAGPRDWLVGAAEIQNYSDRPSNKTWIWDLQPASALYALEELGQARLKRHKVLRGVVVVPRLLRTEWGRRFSRITDVFFEIPPGAEPYWPSSMHEPLVVGLYLPLLRHKPWDWRRVPFLVPFGRALSAMFAQDATAGAALLREFWEATLWVATLPEKLVCTVLCDKSWRRFLGIYRKRCFGDRT